MEDIILFREFEHIYQSLQKIEKYIYDSSSIYDSSAMNYTLQNCTYKMIDNPYIQSFSIRFQNKYITDICSICYNPMQKPIQLHCSHSFCSSCFYIWKKNCIYSKISITCPLCRKIIDTAST